MNNQHEQNLTGLAGLTGASSSGRGLGGDQLQSGNLNPGTRNLFNSLDADDSRKKQALLELLIENQQQQQNPNGNSSMNMNRDMNNRR